MSESRNSSPILLVNPDWRRLPVHGRFRVDVPYFPLELMYISSALEERGFAPRLADQWAGTMTDAEYRAAVPAAKYIILTTAPTYIFWRAGVCDVEFPKSIIHELRSAAPGATIIIIGPQGTTLPETMADAPFDYLIRGEADLVTAQLIERLENNQHVADLPGVCPRRNGELHVSTTVANVADLNTLPLLNLGPLRTGKYAQVAYEASRGCPYDCTFCFRAGFREKFRTKKPERIRAELERYSAAGYNHIAMIDEIFGMGPRWLEQFCDVMRPLNLRYGIQTRTECLSPERLRLLLDSGCMSIEIGLESADPDVSSAMGKDTDYAHLAANIREAVRLKFEQIRLFCIFGAPKETPASIAATEDYLMQFAEHPQVHADVFPHMPLPGTPVWHQARQQNAQLNDWSDVKRLTACLDNQFKSPDEVERYIDAFDRKWTATRARHARYRRWARRLAPVKKLIPAPLRRQIRHAVVGEQ